MPESSSDDPAGNTRSQGKMQEGVKSGVRVPPVELVDCDGGSHAMMNIPSSRNDPGLKGAQGKLGVPQASGTADELGV